MISSVTPNASSSVDTTERIIPIKASIFIAQNPEKQLQQNQNSQKMQIAIISYEKLKKRIECQVLFLFLNLTINSTHLIILPWYDSIYSAF